jgi:hypothetical protein
MYGRTHGRETVRPFPFTGPTRRSDDADPSHQHGQRVTAPAMVRPRRRNDPDRKTRIVDAAIDMIAGADSP